MVGLWRWSYDVKPLIYSLDERGTRNAMNDLSPRICLIGWTWLASRLWSNTYCRIISIYSIFLKPCILNICCLVTGFPSNFFSSYLLTLKRLQIQKTSFLEVTIQLWSVTGAITVAVPVLLLHSHLCCLSMTFNRSPSTQGSFLPFSSQGGRK